MASSAFRLQRSMRLSYCLFKRYPFFITPLSSVSQPQFGLCSNARVDKLSYTRFGSFIASFHSTSPTHFSSRFNVDDGKISPDTILFEGCDYKHWLITMDFPKDPKPTAEEMVETYVQTCAKGLGCSIEEAKKKIYACSTTTYQGFQAEMTEEESEKFRGLPGVVFILPDSYIDPANKEYGGDKYINGTIIPRPPPVQYSSRRRDRPPRYDRPRDTMQMQQGAPSFNRQPPMQGDGRNFAPQQNYGPPAHDIHQSPMQGGGRGYPPQQNYGPPGQDARQGLMQGDFHQSPMQGGGRGYAPPLSYTPPGQEARPGPAQGDGRSFGPPQNFGFPGQGAMQGDGRSYSQQNVGTSSQGYGSQQNVGSSGQVYESPQNVSPSQVDGRNQGPYGGRGPSPVQSHLNAPGNYQANPPVSTYHGGQANYPPGGSSGFRPAYGPGDQPFYGQNVSPSSSQGYNAEYRQDGSRQLGQNFGQPVQGQGYSQSDYSGGMPEQQGNYGPAGQSGGR